MGFFLQAAPGKAHCWSLVQSRCVQQLSSGMQLDRPPCRAQSLKPAAGQGAKAGLAGCVGGAPLAGAPLVSIRLRPPPAPCCPSPLPATPHPAPQAPAPVLHWHLRALSFCTHSSLSLAQSADVQHCLGQMQRFTASQYFLPARA